MPTAVRTPTLPRLLVLGALAVAACDVTPAPGPDVTVDPEDLTPPDAATLAGHFPMVMPIEDPTRNQAPTRLRDSDGSDDPELAAFLDAMPGASDFQPVRADETIEHALDRFAAARPEREAGFSYVGMVTERGHYLVEIDDDAMMLVKDRLEMIAEGGMATDDYEEPLPAEAEDDLEYRGWSNGFDSRVRLTGSSIPNKVGRVAPSWGGQCSGSLIGRRIVRTAAHCVVKHTTIGAQVAASVTFDYRRDAGTVPVSAATSTFYYGGNYIPSGCAIATAADYSFGYRNNFGACTWADWAMLILPTDWNDGVSHSWFGYKGLVGGDIGMELQSGGYPGCGLPESPASCVNQAYYRDESAPCEVAAWTSGTSKWRVGCDTSPGNSGGPVWEEGTAYLIGHCQWQDCATCPSGSTNQSAPNHYLGHDDWLFNFQNDLRSTYP